MTGFGANTVLAESAGHTGPVTPYRLAEYAEPL
jgi:hypothetical protein